MKNYRVHPTHWLIFTQAANLLGSLAGRFGGAMDQVQTPHAVAVPMHTPVPVAQGVAS